MIIFRNHRGLLADSMNTAREFESFTDLQKYICECWKPFLNLLPEDVIADDEIIPDERIGWEDQRFVCIRGYDEVSDKSGFKSCHMEKIKSPFCVGMFATKYKNK